MDKGGYDKLSIQELDLLFKEEFHSWTDEDVEQILLDIEAEQRAERQLDLVWEEFLRMEEEDDPVNKSKKIVDTLLGCLRR
jgi:hypothetical protein